eukprot:3258860-Pyramimonas_sp.AAC.1
MSPVDRDPAVAALVGHHSEARGRRCLHEHLVELTVVPRGHALLLGPPGEPIEHVAQPGGAAR